MLTSSLSEPLSFRRALVTPLFDLVRAGESFAVVAPASMGKSRLTRFVLRDDVQQHYLGEQRGETLIVLCDFNRLAEVSEWGLYEVILTSLIEACDPDMRAPLLPLQREAITSRDGLLARRHVELAALMLCRERERGVRLCLLLDEFDELCRALPPPALANLRALRDANKYQLCYGVFVRDHPARLRPPGEYEGFYELFSRSVLWLGPYDDADALDMLRLLEARRKRALTPDQRSRIVALSGGHPGLITALFDAFSADPELFSSSEAVLLSGVVEEEARKLWDSFASDEKLALNHVAQGVELDKTIQQLLLNKGVLRRCDGAPRIFSPVFAEFVHRNGAPTDQPLWIDEKARVVWVGGARHDDLTASEFDLLAFLYATPGELRTHEEIHRHLYAEDKVIVGNALEALVKRLRQKIEPERRRPRYLLTVHKKGYRLVIHPVLEAHQQSAQARFTASTSEPSATMSHTARR